MLTFGMLSLPETKTSENSWFENYISVYFLSFPSTTTPPEKKNQQLP